jgi:hypothetical protein
LAFRQGVYPWHYEYIEDLLFKKIAQDEAHAYGEAAD